MAVRVEPDETRGTTAVKCATPLRRAGGSVAYFFEKVRLGMMA